MHYKCPTCEREFSEPLRNLLYDHEGNITGESQPAVHCQMCYEESVRERLDHERTRDDQNDI